MKKYFIFIIFASGFLFFYGFNSSNDSNHETLVKKPKIKKEIALKPSDKVDKNISFVNETEGNANKMAVTGGAEDKEVQQIELITNDIVKDKRDSKTGASKTYKEVAILNLNGSDAFSIKLDRPLQDVASVVVVSLDAPIIIEKFSANKEIAKEFTKGQETMQGDWVKLDGFKGELKTIEINTLSEERNRLKVYVQYFGSKDYY